MGLTLCQNFACAKAMRCLRFLAKANEPCQWYADFLLDDAGHCAGFIEADAQASGVMSITARSRSR